MNIYSSWDYLNEEKNSGKLCLSEYEALFENYNVDTVVIQVEASDPRKEALNQIQLNKIDEVYIGASTLRNCVSDSNIIFNTFSVLKR